jgi:hypothetical protein
MNRIRICLFATLTFIIGFSGKIEEEKIEEDQIQVFHTVEGAWYEASMQTGFSLDDSAKNGIWIQYANTPDDIKKAIHATPVEVVNGQISKYLISKKLAGASDILSLNDVSDFSWEYITQETDFIPIKINPLVSLAITRVETGNLTMGVEFFLKDFVTSTHVFPRNFICTISGSKPLAIIDIQKFSYSEGCEIYINSDPAEADVYFNNKKYYDKTNTSAVRNPGRCKVTIIKAQYEDWDEEKELKEGDVWIINAWLKKQTNNEN